MRVAIAGAGNVGQFIAADLMAAGHQVTLILPSEWAGWKVEELEADGHRRVVGVTRTGHARIVGPGVVLQEGDQVHLAVDEDGLHELRPRVLAARRDARDEPVEVQESRP